MPKGEDITTKFRVDISDLKKGITEANNQIKLANAQFKAASAGMDNWAKSSDGIKAKLTQLSTVLDAQKAKLKSYKDQQAALNQASEENARRADQLKAKLQELANNGVAKTSDEYKKYQTALNQVEREQLANQTAADKLKVTIANQEAAVAGTEKEMRQYDSSLKNVEQAEKNAAKSGKTVEEELQNIENQTDKTESKLGQFGKSLAANLGKAAVAAAATATAALVGLAKTAVANYAEYEQLVGGVETLFGESSDKVLQYANNAYKTAGLSANQYMETVTSFSASLLQSLGGNAQLAAEFSDMAIKDMSDNANKMGTDMARIQDAYQGFAKQNYTMLDNLKLGYGGTKTEMQRLLADAEKLTGVKYDINNLADVYRAIHVIQGELGITGTTAKEAASTIQGSVNSMKAAWTNLITAMADDTQDFGGLLDTFVDSVHTVAANLIPRIKQVVDSVFKLVQGLLPSIVDLIQQLLPEVVSGVSSILDGVIQVLPAIIQAVVDVLPAIVEALLGATPKLLKALIQIVNSVFTGLGDLLPKIIEQVVEIIPQLAQNLVEGLPILLEGAVQLLMAIVNAIPIILPQIVDALPLIISTIVSVLLANLPMILNAAIELFMALVKAIPVVLVQLVKAIDGIILGIITGLTSGYAAIEAQAGEFSEKALGKVAAFLSNLFDNIRQWFTDTIDGFVEWCSNVLTQISTWSKNMASKAKKAGTDFLNNLINIIKTIPTKIANIFTSVMNKVSTWTSNMTSKAKTAGTNFLNKVVDNVKKLPSQLWTQFKNAITKVSNWSSQMVSKGKTAAANLVKTVVNKVKEIPNGIANVGKDLVEGLWKGISNSTQWLKNKFEDWVGSPLKWAKKILGIHSPSKKFAEIGAYIDEGLAEGIEANKGKPNEKVTELAESLLDDLAYMDLSVYAKKTTANIAEAANNAAEELLSGIKKKLSNLKVYNKMSLQDEMRYWEDARKQFKEGTEERIEADESYFNAREKLLERLTSLEENYNSSIASINESWNDKQKELMQKQVKAQEDKNKEILAIENKLSSDIENLWDKYYDKIESRASQIASSFGLFDEVKLEGDVDSSSLITNLENQVSALEEYQEIMSELSSRGISDSLKEQLTNAGVKSLKEIKAIASMSDEELEKYDEALSNKLALAKKMATEELKSAYSETQLAVNELKKAANREIEEVYETYREQMATINNELAEGFAEYTAKLQEANEEYNKAMLELTQTVEKESGDIDLTLTKSTQQTMAHMDANINKGMQTVITDFTANGQRLVASGKDASNKLVNVVTSTVGQLPREMRDIGEDLVYGLWRGIESMEDWLLDNIYGLSQDILEEFEKDFDINSPSKVMANSVGRYLPEGIAVGIDENTKSVFSSIKNLANKTVSLSNNLLSGIQVPTVNVGASSGVNSNSTSNVNNFTQIINAPKQPSRIELYRQTRNLLDLKGGY